MEWISPIFIAFAIVVFLIYEGYFKEKGKNLATKEDIEEITEKIEVVKSEIENISFKKQDRFIQFKESLLELNKEYTIFVEYSLKNISCTASNFPDPKEINTSLKELVYQLTRTGDSLGRVAIYADHEDDKWLKELYKSYMKSIPLYKETIGYLESCQILSEHIQYLESKGGNAINKREEYNSSLIEYRDKRDKMQSDTFDAANEIQSLIKEKLNTKYKE